MIKGVIFDFDGVIIDSNKIANKIFLKLIRKNLGIEEDLNEFTKMVGLRFEQRIKLIGEKFNINISEETLNNIMEDGRKEYREIHLEQVFMFPGAKELIHKLHKNNYKIALGTNGSRQPVLQKLDHLDIKKYFSSIVTADDVINLKPDSEMFLKNAEELDIKAKECIVIEDSITGINAAKKAGIKVIAVETTLSKEQLQEADWVVESIKDIDLETIKKIGGG